MDRGLAQISVRTECFATQHHLRTWVLFPLRKVQSKVVRSKNEHYHMFTLLLAGGNVLIAIAIALLVSIASASRGGARTAMAHRRRHGDWDRPRPGNGAARTTMGHRRRRGA